MDRAINTNVTFEADTTHVRIKRLTIVVQVKTEVNIAHDYKPSQSDLLLLSYSSLSYPLDDGINDEAN